MSAPALPVTVPSTSTSLTKAQAFALADFWVSEHNRVPFQLSSDDHLATPPRPKQLLINEVFNFWPFNISITPSLPRVSLTNLFFRGFAWVRRRVRQGQVAAEFGVPDEVLAALRRAFAAAIANPRVQTMADKDQRSYLGEVLWAALRNERAPPP